MKRVVALSFWLIMMFLITACGLELGEGSAGARVPAKMQNADNSAAKMMVLDSEKSDLEEKKMMMNVQVGDTVFAAELEDNEAAEKFAELMKKSPVVISMSDYAGFEKSGDLGMNLPTSNSQTTANPGDIVLYNGNKIVIFYGSNSWSYTRIGKIINLDGWVKALGSGDVTVTFSINEAD